MAGWGCHLGKRQLPDRDDNRGNPGDPRRTDRQRNPCGDMPLIFGGVLLPGAQERTGNRSRARQHAPCGWVALALKDAVVGKDRALGIRNSPRKRRQMLAKFDGCDRLRPYVGNLGHVFYVT